MSTNHTLARILDYFMPCLQNIDHVLKQGAAETLAVLIQSVKVYQKTYISVLSGVRRDGQQRSAGVLVEGVKRSLLGLAHKDEGGKSVAGVRVVPVLGVFVAAAADPVDLPAR